MTEKQFRLLLTLIFMAGASFLIYNKFTKGVVSVEAQKNQPAAPNKTVNTDASINKNSQQEPPDQINTTATTINENNINSIIQKCSDFDTLNLNSLSDLSDQLELGIIKPNLIQRINYIYNINNQEVRVSLFPSDNLNTWSVQDFKVDTEGLPIPGDRVIFNTYDESLTHINKNFSKSSLKTTEKDLKYTQGANAGTALLVNDQIVKLTNHNSKLSLTLECQNKNCICNRF